MKTLAVPGIALLVAMSALAQSQLKPLNRLWYMDVRELKPERMDQLRRG